MRSPSRTRAEYNRTRRQPVQLVRQYQLMHPNPDDPGLPRYVLNDLMSADEDLREFELWNHRTDAA